MILNDKAESLPAILRAHAVQQGKTIAADNRRAAIQETESAAEAFRLAEIRNVERIAAQYIHALAVALETKKASTLAGLPR